MTTTVIIGASVAGVRTAQALRAAGVGDRIVLVGAEPDLPYDRPPLSKGFLVEDEAAPTPLFQPGQAEAEGVELRLGVAARALDLAARRVELDDGEWLEYDRLVLATGASARRPAWAEDPDVHLLRTLADARGLRGALARGGHLVVVGAGFIGSEVASSARSLGLRVTLIDPLQVPAERVVGREVGLRLTALATGHGVEALLGVGVEDVTRTDQTLHVRLTDGRVVAADSVLVGVGVVPNDGWLLSSGLAVDDGVLCDAAGRVAGAEDVYAVGDVARWDRPGGTARRVEHWTSAVDQAAVVARAIATDEPAGPMVGAPVDYVWSDQFGRRVQIAGQPHLSQDTLLLEQPNGAWACLYADAAGILVGATTLDWPRAILQCRRGLATPTPVSQLGAALGERGSNGDRLAPTGSEPQSATSLGSSRAPSASTTEK